jgi:hypothetical protein
MKLNWNIILVLLTAATCLAQRGTLTPVATQPVSLFTLAPAPARLMSLKWDNVAPAYRVQVGAQRGVWTNSFIISTNRFVLTNNLHYAVWSVSNGAESPTPSLWPSNRIGEIWLTDRTNNIVRLERFTNAPPEAMRFWGVANITTGWE